MLQSISLRLKKINPFLFPKKKQKGMALIMVLSTIVFIILLVQETVFETQIEYRSAISELNSLRSYYAAKSGMEVNLLRVKTYRKITTNYANQIKPFHSYIDLIWQFPFQWPPPIPAKQNSINNTELLKIIDNSFMTADFKTVGFITSIEPTAGRIDINDLASPIPSLRRWTFTVLLRLIYHLRIDNEKLDELDEIKGGNIIKILDNIKDWVDPDTLQSHSPAISENTLYNQDGLPPNHSFINLEELHQVAGMSDTLYTAIAPFITVYGEKGLNINTAPVELLQALHNEFPIELAQEIAEMTSNPADPFVFTKSSFSAFLTQKGFYGLKQYLFPKNPGKNNESVSYLYFDAPHNFQMQSTGIAGKSQRTITAIYFDTPSFSTRFKTLMKEEKERERKKIEAQIRVGRRQTEREAPLINSPRLKQNNAPVIIYWKESF